MAVTLTNAILLNLDPLGAQPGGMRVVNDRIAAVGASVNPEPGDEIVDCHGAVVLPGLVNGHTHLYSALAVGMPPPSRPPRDFQEILELIWWRLDRALDAESIELSGAIGAVEALKCGTTTLIDHHASPNCIAGSLDILERGIDSVGLRSVLCYETTDRNGRDGAAAGLAENRRYLERCRTRGDGRHAALVGAHAAFTLCDDSLSACAALAAEFGTGVHVHVAEDPCDDAVCRDRYGAPLVERLTRCGVLDPAGGVASRSILAHGTHLSLEDAPRLSTLVGAVAHNPRSNMNNRVGYAPVAAMTHVQIGTDGIGGDMFTEAKCAWFKARDAGAPVAPGDVMAMLAHAARTASAGLGVKLGVLEAGAAADVVITRYLPPTPIESANAAGHFLFGLGPQFVRDVMIGGRWALRMGSVVLVDERDLLRRASPSARALWDRMATL